MAFVRIVPNRGRPVVELITIPDNLRQSEEVKAAALLEEREKSRAPQLAALRPVVDLDQPVQPARRGRPKKEVK